MKHQELLTKEERKQILSWVLRQGIQSTWSRRSFAVFEKHLNQAEDESLPKEERVKAANKIDRMFYKRLKKHGTNK